MLDEAKMPSLKDKIREESEKELADILPALEVGLDKKVGKKKGKLNK